MTEQQPAGLGVVAARAHAAVSTRVFVDSGFVTFGPGTASAASGLDSRWRTAVSRGFGCEARKMARICLCKQIPAETTGSVAGMSLSNQHRSAGSCVILRDAGGRRAAAACFRERTQK